MVHEPALSLEILQSGDWVDILVTGDRWFWEGRCTMDDKRLTLIQPIGPTVMKAAHSREINASVKSYFGVCNINHASNIECINPKLGVLSQVATEILGLLRVLFAEPMKSSGVCKLRKLCCGFDPVNRYLRFLPAWVPVEFSAKSIDNYLVLSAVAFTQFDFLEPS